jgi:uncharacterized protein YbjQ (UPF0145 family)
MAADGGESASQLVLVLIQFGMPIVVLVVTYFIGHWVEKQHYVSIREREQELVGMPAVTFRTLPQGWVPERSGMVTGSVVISLDYFKRFLAGLRGIVGGRIKGYESLLDRARREALLRLKEEAGRKGYDAILNVRLETSRLATGRRDGKGTAGVEVLAFGTAVKLSS